MAGPAAHHRAYPVASAARLLGCHHRPAGRSFRLLDFTVAQFFERLRDTVGIWNFYTGIIKAPVFGFVIAAIGCYEGLQVTGSAESVGRLTTKSVVESIFFVIVLDAVFSIIFLFADV